MSAVIFCYYPDCAHDEIEARRIPQVERSNRAVELGSVTCPSCGRKAHAASFRVYKRIEILTIIEAMSKHDTPG